MRKYHYFIAFVTFIGYFIGLTLVVKLDFPSRYYSVPLRFGVATIMLYLYLTNHKPSRKIDYKNFIFVLFWFIYIISVIRYCMFDNLPTSVAIDIIGYSLIYSIIPFFFYSFKGFNLYLNDSKNAIILSGIILSVISFFQYWGDFISTGVSRLGNVVYSLGDDYKYLSDLALSYSASIIMGLTLFNIIFLRLNFKVKMFNLVGLLIAIIPFLLGASRGSVISLVFPFIFILGLKSKLSLVKRISIFLIIIITGFFVYFFADKIGSSVFTRTFNITSDIESGNDSAARLDIWYTSIIQFINSPLLGDYILNRKWNFYPHNLFIEVLMATGLIGFIPFVILIYKAFIKCFWIIKHNVKDTWVSIIFLQGFIMSSFSGSISDNIVFWAGMGLVFSINKSITKT